MFGNMNINKVVLEIKINKFQGWKIVYQLFMLIFDICIFVNFNFMNVI